MSVGTQVWQSAFSCFLLDGSSTMFTLLKHTNENTGFKCSSCYQFPFQKSHSDLNSNPWISLCCAETGESICDVRPGTSEDSTHLVEFGFASDSYYFCLFFVKLLYLESRKPFYRCRQRV